MLTVVDPEAEIAAAITESGRIGVLATPTTVDGGAYRRALERQVRVRELEVTEVAAPDLATIIQNGFPFDEHVIDIVRAYCTPLTRADIDTLILGCTHYPLLTGVIGYLMGPDVFLVNSAEWTARNVFAELTRADLHAPYGATPRHRFLASGVFGGTTCDQCCLQASIIFLGAHLRSALRMTGIRRNERGRC